MKKTANYEVQQEIYQGKRSAVFRVVDENRNSLIIKKVSKNRIFQNHNRNVLADEYSYLCGIESPHVVKTVDFVEEDDDFLLIMEDNQSIGLNEYIKDNRVSTNHFLSIAIQIAKGLVAIHEKDIIHQDINPGNIIIHKNSGDVKIIDFDIAAKFDFKITYLGNPQKLKGSLAYMSPEQTGRMNRYVDYRTDLYSFGATLYELLTGRIPFQVADPMEMVHAHLATVPVAPHVVDNAVPVVISKLIVKLLSKNPEERYQSATGLVNDLQKLKDCGHEELHRMIDFELGRTDFSGKLHISEKLYGRDDEIRELLDIYQRIGKGGKTTVFVTGYSGTGKTSLVNEIHKPITKDRGYFIQGKFDQLQRNVPYFAFIQAFKQYCDLLLTESEDILEQKKEIIQKALGDLGKIITDLVPDLETIIEKQPDLTELEGAENKNRINFVFTRFIRAISTADQPLVMFIDDLQWIDSESLNLLNQLTTDNKLSHFLFVGAYRDNEVPTTHRLAVFQDELKKENIGFQIINIGNLEKKHIRVWLEDSLHNAGAMESRLFDQFVDGTYQKTQGNTFFTIQFIRNLYQQEILSFNFSDLKWEYSPDKLQKLDFTENVIDLLIHRIKTFDRETQEVLKAASCIGNCFDRNMLSVILGIDYPIQEPLRTALGEKLIFLLDESGFRFAHDRIQQAAYALITESEKKPMHLKIGRLLLKQYSTTKEFGDTEPNQGIEDHIFDITNHLNQGADLISEIEEKAVLIKLNRRACHKARSSGAFVVGWEYAKQGLDLISSDAWQYDYNTTYALYIEGIRLSLLNAHYDIMGKLCDTVLGNARHISEKKIPYVHKVLCQVVQHNFNEAVDLAIEVMKQLGLDISRRPSPEEAQDLSAEVKSLLDQKGIDGLRNLPSLTNENIEVCVELFGSICAPVAIIENYYVYAINKMVQTSLKYGESAETANFFCMYGANSASIGDFEDAYKYASLSMEIIKRYLNTELLEGQIAMVNLGYSLHWKMPYQEMLVEFTNAYQLAIEVGDFEWGGYLMPNVFLMQRYIGVNLSEIIGKSQDIIETIDQLGTDMGIFWGGMWFQVIQKLADRNPNPGNIELESFGKHPHGFKLWIEFFLKASQNFLNCIMDRPEYGDCTDIFKVIPVARGYHEYANNVIYMSLIKLQQAKALETEDRKKLVDEVKPSVDKVKAWAEFGAHNYLHRYYLLQAEICHLTEERGLAGEFYDKSIIQAKASGFLCDEALANELAAKFYLSSGREPFAEFYFKKAWQVYRLWGATAKVIQLEEKYPKYLAHQGISATLNTTETTFGSSDSILDIGSILKATQTLSGEVHLEKLLQTMMRILLENAGAQRGMLIEHTDGRLLIQAEGLADDVKGILQALPVEESREIPLSIVKYVARSQQKLVSDNISKDVNYSTDIYIQNYQPKSVVCFPVIKQGKLSGIIYLENNLVEGAFTPARLEVLNILSTQIAISMENAGLYENLEDKVAKRTLELKETLSELELQHQKLKETQSQLVQSEKMAGLGTLVAGIAHEINNPANFVRMGGNNLDTDLKEFKELLFNLIEDADEEIVRDFEDKFDRFFKSLENVIEGSSRIKTIVEDLRSFSRLDEAMQKKGKVGEGLNSTLRLIKTQYSEQVEFICDSTVDPEIEMYPARLNQVFLNLMTNACHAIEKKQAQNNDSSKGKLTIRTFVQENYLGIQFWDTGCGMTDEEKRKIFEPFFSTKEVGHGTGLGMSVSFGIIEKHNGRIEIDSTLGEGSVITLFLPLN